MDVERLISGLSTPSTDLPSRYNEFSALVKAEEGDNIFMLSTMLGRLIPTFTRDISSTNETL